MDSGKVLGVQLAVNGVGQGEVPELVEQIRDVGHLLVAPDVIAIPGLRQEKVAMFSCCFYTLVFTNFNKRKS